MHPRTNATLKQLNDVLWFRKIGVPDTKNAVVLNSWHDAIRHADSEEWEGLCLDAANHFRMRLAKNPDRLVHWNRIVEELKPRVEAFVLKKAREAISDNDLVDALLPTIQWDILHLCMEAEYADVFPPGFYASQGHWYMRGHFPCGWEGVFPEGKLIIY
jgi:hypothetical protein